MYQGKFDNKHKKTSVDVHELVEQRNAVPQKKKKAAAPAPVQEIEAPVKKQKKAAPQPEPPVPEKKKNGPRMGGVVFYTFFFMFILLNFVGVFFGLKWLQNWLVDYEAAQPTVKGQQVFDELFADPDWAALYDLSNTEDSLFEGKDAYVAYMEEKVGGEKLTYWQTSAGLSTDKKYVVQLGDEKIAYFTLTGEQTNITDIPDWQLGTVDLIITRDDSIRIQKMDGHTAYVNGIPLDDSYTIQIASTSAEDYLPIGLTGVRMCTQQVTGLMAPPVVTVLDKDGNNMEVTYDPETNCYTEQTESNTMPDEHKELALEAVKTYCKWMIEEINNRGAIAKYFDPSSDAYKNIVSVQYERWMQDHNGYKFTDESVTDYAMYGDSIFSVRVSLALKVTRTDGTVRTFDFDQALFFNKKDSGKWLCYAMTNVDVSQPRGEVRLTFMDGSQVLTTGFYDTDASNLTVPTLSAPEGKVFAGWALRGVDEDGRTTLTIVFQPDSNGKVNIPEGTVLEPMVLEAFFQDAAEVPADTSATDATGEGAA